MDFISKPFTLHWCNSSIRARLNVSIPATIVAAPPPPIQTLMLGLLQALLQIRMPIVATIVAN